MALTRGSLHSSTLSRRTTPVITIRRCFWRPTNSSRSSGLKRWNRETKKTRDFERKKKESQQKQEKPNGWEIGYQRFTINGKCLGYGDPVRVKEGQRVLFHILNASATENIQLALPGHRFQIVALDGNPVPHPHSVEVLELGTAERISAVVEMNNPGVWILGTPMDDDRKNGMGIVVEYANRTGAPRWVKPPKAGLGLYALRPEPRGPTTR